MKSTTILKLTAAQAQSQENTIMRLDRIITIMAEIADERESSKPKPKPKRKS